MVSEVSDQGLRITFHGLKMTLGESIKCHNAEWRYAECQYAECHYAECHYAECHYAEFVVMLSVVMLNVIRLSVFMLGVVILIAMVSSFSHHKIADQVLNWQQTMQLITLKKWI